MSKTKFLALASASIFVIMAVPVGGEGVLISEDFTSGMSRWWVEGGERTWVHEGGLYMKADPAKGSNGRSATAWLNEQIPPDVRIEFDAQVISSSAGVNNLNVFVHFADPTGLSLYETRDRRASASYPLYHQYNGYIFTFLADTTKKSSALPESDRPARIRIRRCPGCELIAETYAYHNREGYTYKIEILKRGTTLTFSVDGDELLRVEDENPHEGGLFALRTFGTFVKWSNVQVVSLAGGE